MTAPVRRCRARADWRADVGASQMMVDGKIKLKNDSLIKRFTKTGLEFEDGSTVDTDVVLFATGCVSPFSVFS